MNLALYEKTVRDAFLKSSGILKIPVMVKIPSGLENLVCNTLNNLECGDPAGEGFDPLKVGIESLVDEFENYRKKYVNHVGSKSGIDFPGSTLLKGEREHIAMFLQWSIRRYGALYSTGKLHDLYGKLQEQDD